MPEGSFYALLAEHGHRIVRDEDFADCYSARMGRPSIAPSLLAMVLLLQHRTGLSDEQAMEAVRWDLCWKIALGLPVDHGGRERMPGPARWLDICPRGLMSAAPTADEYPMKSSLRGGALALVVCSLTIVGAPAAQASPGVCNQASPHWLGEGLMALDPPVDSPAARYTVDIGRLPGNGAGLLDAATRSPSLTVCDGGDDVVVYTDGDANGVDVGDGVVDAIAT